MSEEKAVLKFILKLRLTDLEGDSEPEDMHDSSAGIPAFILATQTWKL